MQTSLLKIGTHSFLLFLSCAVVQPPAPTYRRTELPRNEPLIRIGLVWGKTEVQFSLSSDANCETPEKDRSGPIPSGSWKATLDGQENSKTRFMLVAASMSTQSGAETISKDIALKGFPNSIRIFNSNTSEGSKRLYRVVLERSFSSREEARMFQADIRQNLDTFIIEEYTGVSGKIRITNTHGITLESKGPIILKGTQITIYDLPVGTGFHWQRQETRIYPEAVSLEIDSRGRIAVINTVPIETYLKGVLPSEMPQGFPFEALKAQAVAARSEAMAKIGKAHPNEPFDLCADVHCQVYSGLSKTTTETDRAVQETTGLLLFFRDEICDAVYSAVCGGHTENNDNVWGGKPLNYLRGKYDGPGRIEGYGSLARESNVRRWIDSNPTAHCNSPKFARIPALEYTKKYFRWEQRISQTELQSYIQRKTGRNLGSIHDLIPLHRGSSGRIHKLRIQGDAGQLVLESELSIRNSLSPNTLYSSCFYVNTEPANSRIPQYFILKGAGFGHGVGMCQTGAAILAQQGKHFTEILKHYYNGTSIRRIY